MITIIDLDTEPKESDFNEILYVSPPLLGRRPICGRPFGSEILLPGMEPGTGLQKRCLLPQGHYGNHSPEER